MTKLFLSLAIVAVAVGGWFYVKSGADRQVGEAVLSVAPEVSTTPTSIVVASASFTNGKYQLDASASSMTWEGRRPLIPGYVDTGTIMLKGGVTVVRGGRVASGSVVVDMTTIVNVKNGLGKGMDAQTKHMKSADFFDVEKYPTATFALTAITPNASGSYAVSGTLTIKGITKPVTFAAAVTQMGGKLIMKADKVVLDRTLWGVKYGSGNFFKDLADKVIDDNVTIGFTAVGVLAQ